MSSMSALKLRCRSLTSFSRSSSDELLDVDRRATRPRGGPRRRSRSACRVCRYSTRASSELAQLAGALALLLEQAVELGLHLGLERRQVAPARLLVDPGHDRRGEVQDLLELLGRHVQQVADAARDALEEPDVADRRGQVDVAHALTADLGARDLDAAALADDALVADALVLAAVALPVLGGTEDALAEEAVLLGLERAVVDRLGLGDLAGAPGADLLGGGEADLDGVEVVDVEQGGFFLLQ